MYSTKPALTWLNEDPLAQNIKGLPSSGKKEYTEETVVRLLNSYRMGWTCPDHYGSSLFVICTECMHHSNHRFLLEQFDKHGRVSNKEITDKIAGQFDKDVILKTLLVLQAKGEVGTESWNATMDAAKKAYEKTKRNHRRV